MGWCMRIHDDWQTVADTETGPRSIITIKHQEQLEEKKQAST